MKLSFITLFFMGACLVAAQRTECRAEPGEKAPFHTVWTYTSNQDPFFISRGRFMEGLLADSRHLAFGGYYVYVVDNQKTLLVDGTPASMMRVLQAEYPEGISDEFVKEKLAFALVVMMTNNTSSVIIQGTIDEFAKLKLEGQGKADMQKALKVLRPPVVSSENGNWKLDFDYAIKGVGDIFRVFCEGRKKPFAIDTLTIKTLPEKIPAGAYSGEGLDFSEDEKTKNHE